MKLAKLNIKNKKTLMLAAEVSLVLTLVAMASAFLIYKNNRPIPHVQEPITREQAIPKAQEYLLRDLKSMDPTLRLMLDFLYRKFSINNQFSGQVNTINTSTADPLVQFELKAVARFAYKDSLVDDLGPNPTLVARGANCDHVPLPSNISTLLQQAIDKGSYDLTHVLFSMQLMKELGCKVNNEDSLRAQVLSSMITMAGNEKTEPDLRYECIAFLLYAGKYDSVDPAWIDKMYESQQQDGGWKLSKNDPKSDDHTTVLSLWALLEYNNPAVPYEPILHVPTQQN